MMMVDLTAVMKAGGRKGDGTGVNRVARTSGSNVALREKRVNHAKRESLARRENRANRERRVQRVTERSDNPKQARVPRRNVRQMHVSSSNKRERRAQTCRTARRGLRMKETRTGLT